MAVADDLSSGSLGNLASARALGGLRIATLDAASAGLADLVAMRQPSVVYHLAALVPGQTDQRRLIAESVSTTVAVLEACQALSEPKVVVVLPGSALYGEVPARQQPIKEGNGWSPVGVRGVAARAVLDLLQTYRDQAAVEYTALLAGVIYGARQRGDGGVVSAFRHAQAAGRTAQISSDGRQVRDLLFIDDAVDALVRAASRAGGLTVNIGTGVGTSIREVWERIGRGNPAEFRPRPGEISRLVLSTTRARIQLGWSSWTALDAGLAELARTEPLEPATP